jgi:hypothetical protein
VTTEAVCHADRRRSCCTLFHVGIRFIGIGSGFVVIYGLLTARRFDGWTAGFLATTVLTSVTGLLFPATHFTPGHAVGVLSLLVLGPALWARYRERMAGRWRSVYIICGIVAQYFNFVVLVIQLFTKVPILHELAPTQTELPFVRTQLVVLTAFIGAFSGPTSVESVASKEDSKVKKNDDLRAHAARVQAGWPGTNKENNHEGFCFGFVCQATYGRAEEADLEEGSPRHSEALSRRQDRPILVPRG